MKRPGFSVKEAARITGVPATSVNFWSGRAKILRPEIAYRGKGSRKLFSARNLVQIRVTYLLTQRWIPLATVRALIKKSYWFDLQQSAWGPAEILVCRRTSEWHLRSSGVTAAARPTELLDALWDDLANREDIIVVNLARVKHTIREAL